MCTTVQIIDVCFLINQNKLEQNENTWLKCKNKHENDKLCLIFVEKSFGVFVTQVKVLSLEVLFGIFEDVYEKCLSFHSEASELAYPDLSHATSTVATIYMFLTILIPFWRIIFF